MAKTNLTQTQKLGKVNKDVKITPNTPIVEIIDEPILKKIDPPVVEPPIKVIPTPDVIVVPREPVGGGFTGEIIDDSRLGGGMGREQRFNNDVLNQQRENLR